MDANELEALYRTRYVGFRNALATVTGNSESASDAVQEGFARALRAPRRFQGGSLAAWVWRICLNAALEQRRRDNRALENGSFDPMPPGADGDPDLAAAIRLLPPRRRLIVFLYYFAGLSYNEVAEACEVSEGTVAATLAQARASLRDSLEGSFHG